jgi:hypothetical protein
MTGPAQSPARVGVIPSTGDPAGIIPTITADPTALDPAQNVHFGYEFASLIRAMWTAGQDLTYAEAITKFRDGIDITVWCNEQVPAGPVQTPLGSTVRAARTERVRHTLRLHPDGTITMLDHTDYTIPAGGSSDDLDLDSEMFLKSLGTRLPACVQTVLWLITEQRDPTSYSRLRKTFGVNPNMGTQSPFRARVLYAAVAWAQRDTWPVDAYNKFLNAGTTPRILSHWVSHGWTVHDAVAFLNKHAPFDIAEQWRLNGDTSARAARLAGKGEVPADEEPWIAAGFAPTESDQWRTHEQYGMDAFTPEVAWQWHSQGVMPNSVRDFTALPASEDEAAYRQARPRPRFSNHTHNDPPLSTALAWSSAGMRSDLVLAWYRKFGDNLPLALEWAEKVPVGEYHKIAEWNDVHPEAPISPEQVYRMRRLGIPYDGDLMGRLVAEGITIEQILRPLHMLPAGKRWLGIELRSVLEAHIRESRAAEVIAEEQADRERAEATLVNDQIIAEAEAAGTTLKPLPQPNSRMDAPRKRVTAYEALTTAIDNDNWTEVVQRLRNPWWSTLWRVYIDWLCTHPTPPPPWGTRTSPTGSN